ncbi:hypothetical protein [Microbacterium sp. C7(2022)]|uniref:hypothetical protein n=1 Tax=Microbacterium sp. C7(2022) TaxID=2992759 RepID=UPI00237A735A|nr:hypothetical protein [Microbacterium sp. C7(2022)]MDE0545860.1 hypothetical protein [Microbacterium sp. C7(2022)]
MILAGLLLLAVGTADLMRQFIPERRRWIGYLAGGLFVLVLASGADAGAAGFAAIAAAALWVMTVPPDGRGRGGFWPIGALGALCAIAVATVGGRGEAGPLGDAWQQYAALGNAAFDAAVLVCGAIVFLLESGNVIVRTALRSEQGAAAASDTPATDTALADTEDADTDRAEESMAARASAPVLRGGRLIGPLERVLVFALTLASAYTLIAAVLAAKGIVRFPEINNDRGTGTRAEYFLVGSLVSWVVALACAVLVWWGVHATLL